MVAEASPFAAVTRPLVSIGMPLHNEAQYLRDALNALLRQDYANLELILSDNASSDSTPTICQQYAANDRRIRFTRYDRNIGAQENFNHLVSEAKGTYFFWAAGHDLWAPTFVSACVTVLKGDQSVVLAYPQTQRIRADGSPIDVYPSNIDTRGLSSAARYKAFLWHVDCNLVYGVWRREVLARSGLFRDIYAPDLLLLSEMSLRGAFAKVQQPLWLRRYQRAPETSEQKKDRILRDLKPSEAASCSTRSLVQHYRSLRSAHFALLQRSPMGLCTRLNLLLHTWLAFAVRCNVFPGAAQIKGVARKLMPSSLGRAVVRWLRSGGKNHPLHHGQSGGVQ
jgi:glycosyltransferase involved in cell wall biosynthesis